MIIFLLKPPNLKEVPKSKMIKSIAKEFNISEKRVWNILSVKNEGILGKEILFLMADGKLIRFV